MSAFKIATTGKVARSRFAVFIASSVFGSALVVDLHSSIQFNDASEEFNTVSPHSRDVGSTDLNQFDPA